MSTEIESPTIAELRHGLSALRGNWFWFVLLGIALIVLGMAAISSAVIASLAFAVFFGVLILMSGVVETIVRPIPIVLNKLQVEFFPEGGDLVAGVVNRVYFQALTPLGKLLRLDYRPSPAVTPTLPQNISPPVPPHDPKQGQPMKPITRA